MRVLISGATGLIGTPLAAALTAGGHEVVPLGRGAGAGGTGVRWNPAAGELEARALEGFDAVVHLAGESIARRFSPAHLRAVRESRVAGTRLLCATLARLERRPRVLVSASAIGIYGDRGDEWLDEDSAPGRGDLGEVARAWEAETAVAAAAGIRVALARNGLVLSGRGGALEPLLMPARLGLGGPLGTGRQWWSWIAIGDIVGAILHLIARAELSGPINLVAPGCVRQREFARVLGRVLGRPAFVPTPAFALRTLLGRGMADTLILASARVRPGRLVASGYRFGHGELEPALRAVLGLAAAAG